MATPLSTPPLPPTTPVPAPKKRRWLLYGCGSLLVLLLLIVATVAITIWWISRPIKPVVLSEREKAVVEEKLQHVSGGNPSAPRPAASGGEPRLQSKAKTPYTPIPGDPIEPAPGGEPIPGQDRAYVPGSKVFKLTEREINGLLNENTDLGKSVRLEFARDAINAYLVVPIPQDFPIGGGKMFRARGRFRLSVGNTGAPYAILEDVTVFGLSLPKAWLGGIKGENLLGEAVGERNGGQVLKGVKSLHVEPGALVLEVED